MGGKEEDTPQLLRQRILLSELYIAILPMHGSLHPHRHHQHQHHEEQEGKDNAHMDHQEDPSHNPSVRPEQSNEHAHSTTTNSSPHTLDPHTSNPPLVTVINTPANTFQPVDGAPKSWNISPALDATVSSHLYKVVRVTEELPFASEAGSSPRAAAAAVPVIAVFVAKNAASSCDEGGSPESVGTGHAHASATGSARSTPLVATAGAGDEPLHSHIQEIDRQAASHAHAHAHEKQSGGMAKLSAPGSKHGSSSSLNYNDHSISRLQRHLIKDGGCHATVIGAAFVLYEGNSWEEAMVAVVRNVQGLVESLSAPKLHANSV